MRPSEGAAAVLAAGLSTRMGRSKALLPCAGGTFLATICARLREAGVPSVWVVLGPDGGGAEGEVPQEIPRERIVRNPEPARGPISSLRLVLRSLPVGTPWLMMALVDHPAVRVGTFRRLAAAATVDGIVVPTHGGWRGHPVVFGREFFAQLEAVPEGEGARVVVRRAGARVLEVTCDDPGVLRDVDTPADYEALRREEA